MEMMQLKEISEESGLDIHFINRMITKPEIKVMLGFDPKRKMYPRSVMPYFCWLKQERDRSSPLAKPSASSLALETFMKNNEIPFVPHPKTEHQVSKFDHGSNGAAPKNGDTVLQNVIDAFEKGAQRAVETLIEAGVMKVPPYAPDKLLRATEVAKIVSMSPYWCYRGVPGSVKIGGRRRWRESEVHRWIREYREG